MKKIGTEGNCFYCSNSYSGIYMMTRHLNHVRKEKIFTSFFFFSRLFIDS